MLLNQPLSLQDQYSPLSPYSLPVQMPAAYPHPQSSLPLQFNQVPSLSLQPPDLTMAYQHQNLQQKIISQQQQLSFFFAQQQKMNEISVQVAGSERIRDSYNGGGAVGQGVSYSGGRDSVDYRDGGGYYGGGLDQEMVEENWL